MNTPTIEQVQALDGKIFAMLTEALRACTNLSGEPLLDIGEYAEVVSGGVRIRKAN